MRALLLVAAAACACGGPKSAADPREILEPDLLIDPETTTPQVVGEPIDAESDIATPAECELAAKRMVMIGVRVGIKQVAPNLPLSELRAQVDREMAAQNKDIQRAKQTCVDRGTSAGEARCVARASSSDDLDACLDD